MKEFSVKVFLPKEAHPLLDNSDVEQYDVITLWISNSRPTEDERPHATLGNSNHYYLNKIVHNWLIDNNIEYNISYFPYEDHGQKWCLLFKSKKDAMLFKIVWL